MRLWKSCIGLFNVKTTDRRTKVKIMIADKFSAKAVSDLEALGATVVVKKNLENRIGP
jgi:hypothetical protein